MTGPYPYPDFPYAIDELPAREPWKDPHIRPERPEDLVVDPPPSAPNLREHRRDPDAEIPEHWAWLGGKGEQ